MWYFDAYFYLASKLQYYIYQYWFTVTAVHQDSGQTVPTSTQMLVQWMLRQTVMSRKGYRNKQHIMISGIVTFCDAMIHNASYNPSHYCGKQNIYSHFLASVTKTYTRITIELPKMHK